MTNKIDTIITELYQNRLIELFESIIENVNSLPTDWVQFVMLCGNQDVLAAEDIKDEYETLLKVIKETLGEKSHRYRDVLLLMTVLQNQLSSLTSEVEVTIKRNNIVGYI